MAADDEGRARLRQVVGRPLLVAFWALVLWGTLYGGVLAHAALLDGPRAALARTLSGPDAGAGFLNLALAALAIAVWGFVAAAVWGNRVSAGPRPRVDGHEQ